MSLFDFLKKKPKEDEISDNNAKKNESPSQENSHFLGSLRQRLAKTRHKLSEGIGNLLLGKKQIDAKFMQKLEEQLIMADCGVEVTKSIIADLTQKTRRNELSDAQALLENLKENLTEILRPVVKPLEIENKKPFVILMVGVNGAGKTTTIGKLTRQLHEHNKKILLVAGDTFRAAAIEQLEVWGERNQIPVIAQKQGSDPASVIFDGFQAAKARQMDVMIADTAGRLHTQTGLMEELKKIKRVMGKIDAAAPHEILLVLDASTGQNALQQAKLFHEAVKVTGIVLTKLDGTAKGGIIFAIAKALKIPIRYIGVGESIYDLRPFDAKEFVDAILGQEKR